MFFLDHGLSYANPIVSFEAYKIQANFSSYFCAYIFAWVDVFNKSDSPSSSLAWCWMLKRGLCTY